MASKRTIDLESRDLTACLFCYIQQWPAQTTLSSQSASVPSAAWSDTHSSHFLTKLSLFFLVFTFNRTTNLSILSTGDDSTYEDIVSPAPRAKGSTSCWEELSPICPQTAMH